MKPKNFPARKLLRQLNANERNRVHANERAVLLAAYGAHAPIIIKRPATATQDELNQLKTARDIRTKKYQGVS